MVFLTYEKKTSLSKLDTGDVGIVAPMGTLVVPISLSLKTAPDTDRNRTQRFSHQQDS